MTAIKPITINIPALEALKKKGTDISAEEQQLATMSRSAGWKVLVKYIDMVQKDLEDVNKQAISSGASFEDIGKNTLIISMAQDIITRLLNKVQDAVDACEDGKEK